MFHNYQTKEDIQEIIIDAITSMDRPSSTREVSAWAWNRMLLDGTEHIVHRTIQLEMVRMKAANILGFDLRRGAGIGLYYKIRCPLAAIAIKQVQQNSRA